MRPWNPGDISVVVIITLYLISCSSTDYVFISKDSNLQWTLPDVSYPDPSFIKNIVPTMDIISSQGFPVERHFIQTEDGYILALHRIPSQGVPVLLMHGFAGASDMWVFRNDTTTDLPFVLSKCGFDVWLGNVRGNVYSRHHATLTPDQMEFWKYSLEEYGSYDLPAMIELIRHKTSYDQVIYIGYSIGGMLPFIMADTRPEYTRFIRLNILMAPFVFGPGDKRAQFMKTLKPLIDFRASRKIRARRAEDMELVSRTNTSIATVYNLCGEQSMTYSLCKGVLQKFIGYDPSRNLNRNLARIMSYTRGGTSVPAAYQIWHMYKKNRPLRFDALPPGRDSKYLRYLKKDMGETPKGGQAPGRGDVYDVTKMNVPTIIWYSMNDRLVDQEGIKKLASLAPHIIKLNLISYKPFNHYDYWIHEDINTHVTYDLMDQLNAFLKPNSVPM